MRPAAAEATSNARAVGRVDDAEERQRVEQLRAVVARPHDRGEVGDARRRRRRERSTRAVARNSTTPRSVWPTCGTTESSTSRCTRSGWASAYRSPTYEPYEMPSSVQRSTPSARAQRLHVGDDVVRAEELPPCAELPGSTRGRRPPAAATRSELPISDCSAGQSSAPGAGAALVVDDDPVVVQLGAEDLRDARQRRHAGLARAAGDQRAARRAARARCRRPRRRAAASLAFAPRGRAARRASSTCSRRTPGHGAAPVQRRATAGGRRLRRRRRRRGRRRSRERRGARAHRAGYSGSRRDRT